MIALYPKVSEGKMTASGQIAQQIIDRVMNGEFAEGKPVRESRLAKELETSRNVIREALNLIVGMGILEYVPYCGYRTRQFSIRNMLEWYELREGIEPVACRRLAAARPAAVMRTLEELRDRQAEAFQGNDLVHAFRCDSEFHLAIIRGCGSNLFRELADSGFISVAFLFKNQMLTGQLRDRGVSIYFSREEAESTIQSHDEMIMAMKRGDGERAAREAAEHANIQVRTMECLIARRGADASLSLDLAEALAAANR